MLGDDHLASFEVDGFVVVGPMLDPNLIERLRERFERLFRGEFETGITPDEVNWLEDRSDPALTRQICNGWKADRLIAATVLDQRLGEAVARLAGWPGARIVQDNLLWKPPGAKSLGFHRDNAYLAWYTPREMYSCWIALDDTSASGGTMNWPAGRIAGHLALIPRPSSTLPTTTGRPCRRRRLPPVPNSTSSLWN